MMAINDFSALIELVATMSIAFVAVEYVKSYTSVLCEKFFKFHDFVERAFDECREILTDMDTLNHIEPIDLGGRSTNSVIERAKRKNESLNKEIVDMKEAKKMEVTTACQACSMSSLCFFLFMFNTLLLFVGGLETGHQDFSHVYASILCIGVVIYLVLGWLFGENEKSLAICKFSSLRHATVCFWVIAILSLLLSFCVFYWWKEWFFLYIIPYWWYILIVSILFSYLNFVIFVFKIWNKANEFKKDVELSKNELKRKCQDAEAEVADLLSTSRLSARLQTD